LKNIHYSNIFFYEYLNFLRTFFVGIGANS
jgi:hypothetical protein